MKTSKSLKAVVVAACFAVTACGGSAPRVAEPTIDLGPVPDPHPASAEVREAEALLGAERTEDASHLLETAIASVPNDPRAHFTLGVTRTLLSDAAGAESSFRRALELDANYAEAWNELGLLLRDTSRLPDAVAALGSAVRARPEFYDAWYNLALARQDAGDLTGASEAFDSALPGIGTDPVARFHRAGLFIQMQDAPAAERELLRARSLASARPDVLRAIARTFLSLGKPEAASDTLETALQAVETPDPALLIEASGAARSAHRTDLALQHARGAVDAAATSARAQAMLALVAADAGQRGEARAALEAATRLDTTGAMRADLARLGVMIDALP